MALLEIPRVLVAIDGSPYGERALLHAREIAARFGAQLALVSVIDPLPAIGSELVPNVSLLDELRKEGQETLDAAASTSNPAPARFLRTGRPDYEICRCAADWHAALLVIGTHGRTGLNRVLMGSVAEHVVRHAPCSVLVVRAPAAS